MKLTQRNDKEQYNKAKEVMEKFEDEIIRTLIKENPSRFDVNGDVPIVLDKNGKRLTMKELMEMTHGMEAIL